MHIYIYIQLYSYIYIYVYYTVYILRMQIEMVNSEQTGGSSPFLVGNPGPSRPCLGPQGGQFCAQELLDSFGVCGAPAAVMWFDRVSTNHFIAHSIDMTWQDLSKNRLPEKLMVDHFPINFRHEFRHISRK